MRYRQRSNKTKLVYIIGAVILVFAVAIGGIAYYNHHKNGPGDIVTKTTGAGQSTKGVSETQTGATTGNGSSGTSQKSSSGASATSTNATLTAPYGNFVSDHHPDLSGSPAPNTMSSVCTTVAGATCVISFTQNGVTKSLPSEKADGNGAVYWSWKLQDIGLTQGDWQIVATATLGSQTETATDPMDLDVGP